MIEAAYSQKRAIVEFDEEHETTHALITTKIDFTRMEEYVNGDTRNPRKVHRKTPGTYVVFADKHACIVVANIFYTLS